MSLQKDDPVYYKVKVKELIKQAQENGLVVCLDQGRFLSFMCIENNEIASVCLNDLQK